MTIRVCVSILPQTVNEALKLIKRAEKHGPDFIEVRLDHIREVSRLAEIAESTKIPLIATNRAKDCGGAFSGSEKERQQILLEAAAKGFEYVDIELSVAGLKSIVENLQQFGVKTIISFHDFEKTPEMPKIQEIFREQIENGAEVCKIVTTAKSLGDNLVLLNFLNEVGKSARVVCFAMGPLGKISRLLSPLFGGFFTIASLEKSLETAPGQMAIQELKEVYRALGVI
ncbi:MAG: type I 3-dehydroquinate dehydratase [Nitrososphaerota archaeon]|nr:type I 3-dehydroquinate dehydratase [Candidatus Bathyarchaeota archaeon]MDW8022290.1 type I 3-dehydroquinate dehydratase [Nitrososphaerota archaeon]